MCIRDRRTRACPRCREAAARRACPIAAWRRRGTRASALRWCSSPWGPCGALTCGREKSCGIAGGPALRQGDYRNGPTIRGRPSPVNAFRLCNNSPMTTQGIGERVTRIEDAKLLRGEGTYTDDVNERGQAYAWIVRSQHAHGVLRKIETLKAKEMPGVLAIYTAADLAAYGPHKCALDFKMRDGTPMKRPVRKSLAEGKVRYVGDPVACVVAETALQAKDAAEAVEVDIEPLAAVTLASEAAKPGAPQLYDDVPGNVQLDFLWGEPDKVAAAFAGAEHVTRLKLRNTRVVVAAMEPRSAVCKYEGDRFVLTCQSQGVFALRNQLAEIMGVPPVSYTHLRAHETPEHLVC